MNKFENISIKIKKVSGKGSLLAYVSIILEDNLVIDDIKLIRGRKSKYIVFPYTKKKDKKYGIAYPIDNDLRVYLQNRIIREYENIY